jgi:hypothetical protein
MQTSKKSIKEETTRFLNVDLDIYSRSKLDPLVAAFGKRMDVLYLGRERHLYSAHLELAGFPKSADATIRGICTLILRLPRVKRKFWDAETTRDFDIGLEAAPRGKSFKTFKLALSAQTIQMVSSLNARIVVTVYTSGLTTSAR